MRSSASTSGAKLTLHACRDRAIILERVKVKHEKAQSTSVKKLTGAGEKRRQLGK